MSRLSPPPEPRTASSFLTLAPNGGDHGNVTAVGCRIYLLVALLRAQAGALADAVTSEYDAVTKAWIQVGQMPTSRTASGVSVIGTKIDVPDMPAARDDLARQTVWDRIYALGGRPGRDHSTTASDEFDPVIATRLQRRLSRCETLACDALNDTWRMLALMIAPRNGWYGNGAVLSRCLFLLAGGCRGNY
jgi:hypothetical protein